MSLPALLTVALQTTTTTTAPAQIDQPDVVTPLIVGAGLAFLVLGFGISRVSMRGDDRFLVDPPAVFSLKDGWLTNVTGLSAAAVALVAGSDVAGALLDEGVRAETAFVGLLVVAVLGLAPLLLGLLTRFTSVGGKQVTVTPTWTYAVASALTAGAAVAQLTSLGRAAGQLKQLEGMRPVLVVTSYALGVVAVIYTCVFIERTLGFAGPWPTTEADVAVNAPTMPMSLSL